MAIGNKPCSNFNARDTRQSGKILRGHSLCCPQPNYLAHAPPGFGAYGHKVTASNTSVSADPLTYSVPQCSNLHILITTIRRRLMKSERVNLIIIIIIIIIIIALQRGNTVSFLNTMNTELEVVAAVV